MKTLLKIIGIIILLIIVYAIFAMLAFSKNYHFEKSVVINAPKEKVWQHAGSLKAYNTWDPFSKEIKILPLHTQEKAVKWVILIIGKVMTVKVNNQLLKLYLMKRW